MKELLAKGPLLISFYRGGWCPYCNLALKALEDSLPAIRAKGVTLVAISPELPNQSLTTQEKDELQFPVLSDVGNNLARKLGIVFLQPESVRPILKAYGGRSTGAKRRRQLRGSVSRVLSRRQQRHDPICVPRPGLYPPPGTIDCSGVDRRDAAAVTRRAQSKASATICHEAESRI